MMKKLLAAAVFVAALFVSCGGGKIDEGSWVASRENFDPASFPPAPDDFTITILTISFDGEIIAPDHPAILQLQEHTGYKIKLQYVMNASYSEQLNTRLASGDLPGLVVITGNSQPIVLAAEAGAFWDITDVYGLYPNLAVADKNVLNNISINSRYFGIYRARDIGRNGMIYRSDWLETLGLAVPNTLDELYDVLRAFTRDDPDRDGVDNTIGMAWTGGYLGPFYNLAVMFGAPNRFGLKDGKLVPWFEYGEFFQAMEYCKRLYDEGIINRDFAALQTGDWPMLFSTNRAGWHIDVVDEMSRGSIRLRDNGFITFDAWTRGEHVGGMGPVADRNGEKHIMATPGHAGYVAISTAGARSLQELHYYLDFLDKCNDELGQTIISWGAEGVNWIRNPDSTITTIPSVDIPNGWHITAGLNGFLTLDGAGLFKTPTAQEARYREVYRENLAFVVHDPTLPLAVMSQTWTARAQSLNQIVDDAVINFVMGNIDRAGFGREVARWYSQDGQKALGELQAAYDASR